MSTHKFFIKALSTYLAATVIVTGIALTVVTLKQPIPNINGSQHTLLRFGARDFNVLSSGKHKISSAALEILEFNSDEAIVLLIDRPFKAEVYPFINIAVSGLSKYTNAKLLWSLQDDPATIHGKTLLHYGSGIAPVSFLEPEPAYRGIVASMAILFYDAAVSRPNNNDQSLVITGVTLEPFSISRIVKQIWFDWLSIQPRHASMNNVVRGWEPETSPVLPPNLFFYGVIITAIALTMIRGLLGTKPRNNQRVLANALVFLLLGALSNEMLRVPWRVKLISDTVDRYANLPIEQRIKNGEIRCIRFKDDCYSALLPHF